MRRAVIVAALLAVTITTQVLAAPMENGQTPDNATEVQKPNIYYLHIKSDVKSRYAKTLVTSKVANPAKTAQEVVYQITIPESAFISNFTMLVDGKIMDGQVRERAEAKQEYNAAQQAGQTAGHVATATVRDSNQVRISVNVAAQSKVTFNLTYEELLVRRKGRYELAMNVDPGQIVKDLAIDVFIDEMRNITLLQIPEFRSTNEIDFEEKDGISNTVTVEKISKHKLHISFTPSESDQVRISGNEDKGLGGKFVVRYDVDRKDQPLSEILTKDGYFVHFFSPPEVQPLSKHVVFVLDVSGSMYGTKMVQLKEAMGAILGELKPQDYFNVIEFSYAVTILDMDSPANNTVIKPTQRSAYEPPEQTTQSNVFTSVPEGVKAYSASADNIQKAKDAVDKMSASGGTNIHDSLNAAIEVTRKAAPVEGFGTPLPSPIIIFLTDGEATVGETSHDVILNLVSNEQDANVPIFSLAFGNDADLKFLKRVSLRSGAFARKIYEAADAALQLRDFYRQVASPLLKNVTFGYDSDKVERSVLTNEKFNLMFSGSELVVAGKLKSSAKEVTGVVESSYGNYPMLPAPEVVPPELQPPPKREDEDNFLERLWAFLTIKQQLDKYEAWGVNTEVKEGEKKTPAQIAKEEALKLALQFSFVTPLTSLVVVQRENTEIPKNNSSVPTAVTIGEVDAKEGESIANYALTQFSGQLPQMHNYALSQSGGFVSYSAGFGAAPAGYSAPSFPPAYTTRHPTTNNLNRVSTTDRFGSPGRPLAGVPGRPAPAIHKAPALESLEAALPAEESFDLLEEARTTAMAQEDEQSVTESVDQPTPSSTKVNLTDITWLSPLQNESAADFQSFFLGNSTDAIKILSFSKSQNITGAACDKKPGVCKPFTTCVLQSFTEWSDPEIFIRDFQCDIKYQADVFLGVCCPENDQNVTTTQLEAEI